MRRPIEWGMNEFLQRPAEASICRTLCLWGLGIAAFLFLGASGVPVALLFGSEFIAGLLMWLMFANMFLLMPLTRGGNRCGDWLGNRINGPTTNRWRKQADELGIIVV